jgi:hypothetical protein
MDNSNVDYFLSTFLLNIQSTDYFFKVLSIIYPTNYFIIFLIHYLILFTKIFLQKVNFMKYQKFIKFNFDLRKYYLFVIEGYSFC